MRRLCAGLAAERMTSTERRELEAAHEQLRALIHSGDPQRYHEINEAFHGVIYAGAHNEHFAELTLATRCASRPTGAPSSAISDGWRSRMSSTIAWSWRSCAATATAPPPRCARISDVSATEGH